MRVAVRHTDSEHPNADWFAYGQGRCEDFVHPITGEITPATAVLDAMWKRALDEYPPDQGYEHRVERLAQEESSEDGVWVADVPDTSVPPGDTQDVVLEAEQVQAPEQEAQPE